VEKENDQRHRSPAGAGRDVDPTSNPGGATVGRGTGKASGTVASAAAGVYPETSVSLVVRAAISCPRRRLAGAVRAACGGLVGT
jgi:hypothetical protein